MDLCEDQQRLKEALTITRGNITRAARTLGVTKPYLMILVRKFSLNAWAMELRKSSGSPPTGRPPTVLQEG